MYTHVETLMFYLERPKTYGNTKKTCGIAIFLLETPKS